jgi:RHS repeat-associated protein
LIAEYTNSTTEFVHTDHLGSTRLLTAMNQSIVDNLDYLPYGAQIAGDTGTTHKFTGKERDAETGLDNFGARYYASTMGRFMTPDWAARPTAVPYAVLGDPQSLNLYSYVRNDPVTRVDVDGHLEDPVGTPESFCNGGDCPEYEQQLRASIGGDETSGETSEVQGAVAQNNNDQQTQQSQQSSSKLDKDKVVDYMDEHAKSSSTGKCAAACRKGLEAGGLDTAGHPADAKDYGPFLTKHGAEAVSGDHYKPQKGDVAVFQGNDSHPHGHVEIYDGKQWVSDFKQKNFSPYKSDSPPSTVYRFPDSD